MHEKDIPEYIEDFAVSMAVILSKLGYDDDKTAEIIDRGIKFPDDAKTGDAIAALGDDLDGRSLAVGFSAALGVVASFAGAADIKKQMRKAGDN